MFLNLRQEIWASDVLKKRRSFIRLRPTDVSISSHSGMNATFPCENVFRTKPHKLTLLIISTHRYMLFPHTDAYSVHFIQISWHSHRPFGKQCGRRYLFDKIICCVPRANYSKRAFRTLSAATNPSTPPSPPLSQQYGNNAGGAWCLLKVGIIVRIN